MIITNKKGLPEPYVKACELEENVEGLRVTQLLNGVRAVILTQRHWDEIEVEAAKMVWLILGSAVHKLLEMTDEEDDEFREQRLSMKISNTTLTGKSDLYKNKVITDYKTCSTWKVVYGETDDWQKQLLLYAMLWKDAGFEVNGGEILAIMKDHIETKAEFDPSYPEDPIEMFKWDFTDKDIEDIRVWAEKRIKLIESLENVPDEELPLCTPKERFNDGDKFAIMRNGRKNAKKVCDTREEAESLISQYHGDYIEVRKGIDKKCLKYCMCREFCQYAQSLKGESK